MGIFWMLEFLDVDDSGFRQSHKMGFVCARRNHPEEGPQVRVSQTDKDDLISDWLAVIQKSTIGTRDFWLPQLGEQVLFSTLPNGTSKGFVHGSFYCRGTPPPTTSEHVRHTTFADGTVLEFDSSNSTLTIDSKGPVDLKTKGSVKLASEGDVELTTQGNLNAKVAGSATVEASNIRLKGNVEIGGNLTVRDGLTAKGATFNGDILVNGNGTATGVWKDSTGSGVGS